VKIVVTDGYCANPGDLSWKEIEKFGHLTIHERTPLTQIPERCIDADIVITNKSPFRKELLVQLPKLRLITVLATGYNIIDVIAAREKNIAVCNVPGYATASVAQHCFALMLELTNQIGMHSQSVTSGEWQKNPDWSYTKKPLQELAGKILGIVGLGRIGEQVAVIGKTFGMRVIYNSRSDKSKPEYEYKKLSEVFEESDIISLHCPLTPENEGFVNSALLSTMKKSALLINTARGQLINEIDLKNSLQNDVIAGAGLDVLSQEPPANGNPLIGTKNCIITPHNAWMSVEARSRVLEITSKNIEAFLAGNPINVVN